MLFRFIFYSNIIKDYFENLENRIINYLLINNNYVVLLHQLYIIEKRIIKTNRFRNSEIR